MEYDCETRELVWECYNCGKRSRRTKRTASRNADGLTAAQVKAIASIRERMLVQHYGDRHAASYEFKRFEIDVRDRSVFVSCVTGRIGDEGTLASVMCRRRVLASIGDRGAVKVLNIDRRSRHGGWFDLWHGVTS